MIKLFFLNHTLTIETISAKKSNQHRTCNNRLASKASEGEIFLAEANELICTKSSTMLGLFLGSACKIDPAMKKWQHHVNQLVQ